MINFKSELLDDLTSGFIDKKKPSSKKYIPQILINNTESKILSTVDYELKHCESFNLFVAFVTKSGVSALTNTLSHLEDRNIPGKILVSQYLNFSEPEALKSLLKFSNIETKILCEGNFHGKGYIFKKKAAEYTLIVGSSNLTANALCVNNEYNLKITAASDSQIVNDSLSHFDSLFESAQSIDENFLLEYEEIYKTSKSKRTSTIISTKRVEPNSMQKEALANLALLRSNGQKKAILISATGTGKTYLSAFDAFQLKPQKLLFVVHRANIALSALRTFKQIFGDTRSMGLYNGNQKDFDCDFLFASNLTLSQEKHLHQFAKDHFDYIVFDETHHLGASTHQLIFNYFKPKFCLGMTATPERSDEFNVFEAFDYNIGYEIRLQKALEENMLSPFHYFGITELEINGFVLDEKSDFRALISDARVSHIIDKINFYGTDSGIIRGLVFCRSKDECKELANKFTEHGFRSLALTGENSESERNAAIDRLESDGSDKLDLIFTVDIFNEGIDIPSVNLIVMLRPTNSSIVFVQQLGRGLRKNGNKEYLTVLDFIGNYESNYLIPVALFGNKSFNRDELRRLLTVGDNLIPGASVIQFDEIAKERIYESINKAKLSVAKDLKADYDLLKFEIGRIPSMCDFYEHGARDPFLYVNHKGSFRNYINYVEKDYSDSLTDRQSEILEVLSQEVLNCIRIIEPALLYILIEAGSTVSASYVIDYLSANKDINITKEDLLSAIHNLNLRYITKRKDNKEVAVGDILGIDFLSLDIKTENISIGKDLASFLNHSDGLYYLKDLVNVNLSIFDNKNLRYYRSGLYLNEKYHRKDVFRVFNWESKPNEQNVGGYLVGDKCCPIFVTYNKEDDIEDTIKYEDQFISQDTFLWYSKSKRTLASPDVCKILDSPNSGLRLPLFIKKSNDEGKNFYYIGDVEPIKAEQDKMKDAKGKFIANVVKITFKLKEKIDKNLYSYIIS